MRFDDMAARARARESRKLVVVGAHESNILKGVARAAADGIASPVLLGDRSEIEKIATSQDIDLTGHEILDIADTTKAALASMEMVRAGEVSALMKGVIPTPDFMRIGFKNGLKREGKIISHLAAFDHEKAGRLLMVSDSGIVPFPTLEQRVQIIRNAVEAMRALDVPEPKVAVLAATEEVSDKIPISREAVALKEMNSDGGDLAGFGIVDGPLDFFAAIDPEAAAVKGIGGEVAGRADILHCPDVVAGNLMGKSMIYFSRSMRTGGCVVGGAAPIVLLSRASSADDKYCSILLGLSCS
jgi:phosphate butyryltransferase